jgi:hypothetical protein
VQLVVVFKHSKGSCATVKEHNLIFPCLLVSAAVAGYAVGNQQPKTLALGHECVSDVHLLTITHLLDSDTWLNPMMIDINCDNKVHGKSETAQEVNNAMREPGEPDSATSSACVKVNLANFHWLGLTDEQLLDVCANLHAVTQKLANAYTHASQIVKKKEADLQRARSNLNGRPPSIGFTLPYCSRR